MEKVEAAFNANFRHGDIRLPPEDVATRSRGKIVQGGWAIWYLFGSDDRGEYLDYYASHRMTSDQHVRIRADGGTEDLPTIQGARIIAEDPEEDARREADYFARNRQVAEMLEAKGFGLEGDEPGGVQVNRYLHVNKWDARD